MANFLRIRNGNYFFRLRVPTDLRTILPDVEILKSLRTKDRKTAQISASCMHARFLEVFMLSRHGFITADQANGRIASLIGRNAKTIASETSNKSPSLQKVVDQYTKDNSAGWTAKTRLEYAGYYKLILRIIGDKPVNSLDRDTVRDLRCVFR